ncbi:MAG TPA: tyrosine-type recombinase/integrase [Planctomycetota bacterium]|jgi:integrase/recombinase XerC|nr:tyrosine-type recombinase/integrase [Planctomycetota bacterium]
MNPLPVPASTVPDVAPASVRELLESFLSRRSPRTREAYGKDLDDFGSFIRVASREEALRSLLGRDAATANALALRYKASLLERGLAPATLNRRLSALRSVVALARLVGLASFRLEVPGEKAEPYRDTRGPGRSGIERVLAAVEGDDLRARRDRAILRLLWDLALRRGEIASLRFADLDLAGRRLAVLGKGRSSREFLDLPAPTSATLEAYLEQLPLSPSPDLPLFCALDNAHFGTGLSADGIADLLERLAVRAQLPGRLSPHRIRHASITAALDLTGGDVRTVRAFSRHARVETVLRYDDRRRDAAGKVAALVAGTV